MSSLFSGKTERLASMAQAGAIKQGMADSYGFINDAQNRSSQIYGQAAEGYQPWIDQFSRGAGVYGDLSGANGTEGQSRAAALFKTDPGYEFQQQQGQDAILRNASARGMLAGGNTSVDLLKQSQGLADQSYGNWAARLQPYNALGLAAQAGQSGAYSAEGAQQPLYGQLRSNVATNGATGIGNAEAAGLKAGETAAGNSFQALMGGLNLGAQGLGGVLGTNLGGNTLGAKLLSSFL